MPPVRLEPATPHSRVKHSTTELLCSSRTDKKHAKLPSMQGTDVSVCRMELTCFYTNPTNLTTLETVLTS